jgi:hypothetical protein
MRLKDKYKSPFKLDGVYYDFSNYNEEKLNMILTNHPRFSFVFEEEVIDERLNDLGIETEKQFNDIIKEVIKTTKKRKR